MPAIRLFTLGKGLSQCLLTALVADSGGNLTPSGVPGSFLGRLDEASFEHEDEMENIRSVDTYGSNWVGTGQDDTYNLTEILTNTTGNVIRSFWMNSSPGLRWVRLNVTHGLLIDQFDGYLSRAGADPLKRGKNTYSCVIRRIDEGGVANPAMSGG
jgi:hypothetical protein